MLERAAGQLIVIGSSAGGIEALSSLVATLPQGFAVPIVLAQHLDPGRESHLTQILARRSTLPVRMVPEAESLPLEPGVVFVVPANRDVEITEQSISLSTPGTGRSKPSIDLLFSSAAQVYKERLVAVILTGTGNDGAAGAFEVQQHGGTVVIQDPATATYPALPRSLAPNTVDFVASLENMASVLESIVGGTMLAEASDDDEALRLLLVELREGYGVDFNAYKRPTIIRRLQRRMTATSSASMGDYLAHVRRDPQEQQALVATLLIKVTEFFRDGDLFEALAASVLPSVVETARRGGYSLRFWSAGCATGEEAYSLAIALAELLGDEFERFHVRIFATDLDGEAIAFARQGIYSAASLAKASPELLDRYFDRIEGDFQIKKRIRTMMVFGQHDLADRAPFPQIDLLLCRNVLIYFTADLQRQVLQSFAFALRDNGYLALGKSETTSPFADPFTREDLHLKIYRRRMGQQVSMTSRPRHFTPLATTRSLPSPPSMYRVHPGSQMESAQRPAGRERADSILQDLPLGVVVVDAQYDIQYVNETARSMLSIHSGALGQDFLHLIQTFSTGELRAAIDGVLRDGSRSTILVESREHALDVVSYFEITCYGHSPEGRSPESVTITINDVTAMMRQQQQVEGEHEADRRERDRLIDRVEQLANANRDLLLTNHQLTREMADLRGQNEEFQVGNEELQAASEEIETLNEELQATNEELETLNEELQATVEELNTTNDDLQAQSIEVQALALRNESERARFEAILVSMDDAVLVAGRSGGVTMTNAAYDRLFPDRTWPTHLDDEHGVPLAPEDTPQSRLARRESFRIPVRVTLTDGSIHRLEAVGHAIGSDAEAGYVLVLRDIT